MGRYDKLIHPTQPKDDQLQRDRAQTEQSALPSTPQSTDPTLDQSTNSSLSSSTGNGTQQVTNGLHHHSSDQGSNRIVDRPKAFYITERLDRRLDEAVRYFHERHGIKKIDRSVLLNALLDYDEQWSDEALDRLVDRLIDQLTRRLIR